MNDAKLLGWPAPTPRDAIAIADLLTRRIDPDTGTVAVGDHDELLAAHPRYRALVTHVDGAPS